MTAYFLLVASIISSCSSNGKAILHMHGIVLTSMSLYIEKSFERRWENLPVCRLLILMLLIMIMRMMLCLATVVAIVEGATDKERQLLLHKPAHLAMLNLQSWSNTRVSELFK